MRLIDSDRLKAEIMSWCVVTDDLFGAGKYHEREIVLQAIEESPTIDAAPVVRCKDCKHYSKTGCSAGFGWCENMDRGTHDEFYCASGKRLEVEREKGCVWCKSDSKVTHNGEHFCFFCSYCGKRKV